MFEETRPILSQHPAVPDSSTRIGGRGGYYFQGVEGLDLTFDLTEGYIQSVALLMVGERGFVSGFQKPKGIREDARGIDININIFPHTARSHFVSADEFYYTDGESLAGRPRLTTNLVDASIFSADYAALTLEELVLIEGLDHDFLVGKRAEDVFVDGWVKKTGSLRFRVLIPSRLEAYRILLHSQARLFLFA